MDERTHDELRSLLGAFALNATSPLEARRIERHLPDCADCSHELRLLRESASELALLPEPADAPQVDDLVERISRTLPMRPRRIITRVLVGVAAVALAAVGFLATSLVHERSVNADITKILASSSGAVKLAPRDGFDGHAVLHLASGKAVIVLDDLPSPGRGRTYQLWAIAGAKPKSMTVIGGTGHVVRLFDWRGPADNFAVTIEPSGGSPVPTTDPVLLGA